MTKKKGGKSTPQLVTLEIPLPTEDHGAYRARHIDLHLTPQEAESWRAIYDGLVQTNAKLAGGRYISSQTDAIRWLLQNLRF